MDSANAVLGAETVQFFGITFFPIRAFILVDGSFWRAYFARAGNGRPVCAVPFGFAPEQCQVASARRPYPLPFYVKERVTRQAEAWL